MYLALSRMKHRQMAGIELQSYKRHDKVMCSLSLCNLQSARDLARVWVKVRGGVMVRVRVRNLQTVRAQFRDCAMHDFEFHSTF